ncbi:MAG TPA: glycosyltransferase [Marmoricola sp.]|nr:glycosyltransferase [Nocardioidaceae bacterium]HRV69327.1 glycosyltransferase [Marmoricola sp.]
MGKSAAEMRAVIIMPTYNEAESIGPMIESILALDPIDGVNLDLLVVDDNSPDGTGDIVAKFAEANPRVRLLSRLNKDGLGAAYREGFRAASRSGYDVIVQMDADGSHPVSELRSLIAQLRSGDADLVIGSRYVPGGSTPGWSLRRQALSSTANIYARRVLGLKTRDATAGFRAWTTAAVDTAGLLEAETTGYGFQVENTWRAERRGLRVAEHPIAFVDRVHGASKMSMATAFEAIVSIARWRAAEISVGLLVAIITALSVLARVPFLTRPLSPDEGGFLMVATQWSPGTSLYGNYWVDRPPLLIGIFGLAAWLGGNAVALRLLGVVWVAATVLLAAQLGRLVAPNTRFSPVLASATAAVFMVSPLFGATMVDGELFAAPFVMGGLVCLLSAWRAGRPDKDSFTSREASWWALAGASGVAAGAVKQNMLDVLVLIVVSAAVLVVRGERVRAFKALVMAGLGGALIGVALLTWAWARGTSLTGLWHAVVTFRFAASEVISQSASSATARRGLGLAGAFIASGALLVLVKMAATSVARSRRGAPPKAMTTGESTRSMIPLGVLLSTLLAWEAWGVVAGGSYWLHYLIGIIPGLVLAVAWILKTRAVVPKGVVAALGYSAAASLVSMIVMLSLPGSGASSLTVSQYLDAHARPGDTAVTAFGDPAILQEARLSSPYQYLWSLPVRVRDPQLTQLVSIMHSPAAPTWVLVDSDAEGMDTWGVDATEANRVLSRRYRDVASIGEWRIYHVNDASNVSPGRISRA